MTEELRAEAVEGLLDDVPESSEVNDAMSAAALSDINVNTILQQIVYETRVALVRHIRSGLGSLNEIMDWKNKVEVNKADQVFLVGKTMCGFM